MPKSYSTWPLEKLKKERDKIDRAIQTVEKRDKKATMAQMAALAKKNGFELRELFTGSTSEKAVAKKVPVKSKASKPRGKVAPKYRNPADSKQTWTGRGRMPLWVKDIVDNGGSLEKITIKK